MGPAAAPTILDQVRQAPAERHVKAANALAALGPGAVPHLARALADPNEAVRLVSLLALRDLGASAREALPALGPLANDPDPRVRALAAILRQRLQEADQEAKR